MLDLVRLRALHAVGVHGSVGGAAEALGFTPSAISQQVAKLERETGTTLLERRGRGVALTDAALMLVRTAEQMLSLAEQAEIALEERRGRPAGRLDVAAFPSAARGLLPGALARLAVEHPDLELRMTEVDPHLSLGMVARGEVDLAVAHDWDTVPLPCPEGLRRTTLFRDVCEMLLPADHPLAALDRPLRREDLGSARWVCPPTGSVCHGWLLSTLRAAGQEPDIAYHISEYQTQIALVAAGLGVALLPRLGRDPLPGGVVLRQLEPEPSRQLFAVWRGEASRRPAITEAVRVLRERAPGRAGARAPAQADVQADVQAP